ncbi:hypothetical protein SAY86_021484 [Trapa natans]|uniref:Uncharacterized protein n=1 Tax=Trapa natans TaxID=22666 RepID=A0AAN7MA14_TRANT|nr:hypothetical protein SAY86_021484 [Trapa natans]
MDSSVQNPKSSPKAKSADQGPDLPKDGFLVSCWGRLKLAKLIQWTKKKYSRTARRGAARGIRLPARPSASIAASLMDCKSIAESLSVVQPKPVAGGFKYDPLSYSQNFDEGVWHEHHMDAFQRDFSSRYAAPAWPPRPPPMRSLIDD